MEYNNIKWVSVDTTKTINSTDGETPTGTYQFLYAGSNLSMIDNICDGYHVIKGKFTTTDTALVNTSANDTLALNAGIVSNIIASFFKSANLNINNTSVSNIDEWSTHMNGYKLVNSSEYYEKTSSQSPYLLDDGFSDIALFVTDLDDRKKSHINTRIRNKLIIYEIRNINTDVGDNTYNFSIAFPFPFLQNGSKTQSLYSTNKLTVTYQTNTSIKQDCFVGIDSTKLTDLTLKITHFTLNLPLRKIVNAITSFDKLVFYDCASIQKSHIQSRYSIDVPRNSQLIAIWFSYASGSKVEDSFLLDTNLPNALTLGTTLNSFYMQFLNENYPPSQYDFTTNVDLERGYNDYIRTIKSWNAQDVPIITDLDTYKANPVFVFEVGSVVNEVGSTLLNIYLSSPQTPESAKPRTLNVCCYSKKQLMITYGEFSEIKNTEVSIAV